MPLALEVPRKLAFFATEKARYKTAYGGRGSGKTEGVARTLVALAARQHERVFCGREYQSSMKESVHRAIVDSIDAMGYTPYFDVYRDSIRCPLTGSDFLFQGIRTNPTAVKGMKGVTKAWLEEADKISDESWEIIIPTIREEGSEIWTTFNPDKVEDPTYERLILNPPPNSIAVKLSWRDNPWFPETLRAEKDYLARVDPEAYAHVWEGECRTRTDAQVLKDKYVIEAFEPSANWDGPYLGADWGFAQDPTTLVKTWIGGRTLFVEHEAYGLGVDIDHLPALFDTVPGSRQHVIRADNARPETISYLQRNGFRSMVGAEKWKGSVEDGIAYLRQFERIVIHPRCRHTAEEARLWSYKTDRLTGDILPALKDGNEHCWDGIRYALQPLIKTPVAEDYDVLGSWN